MAAAVMKKTQWGDGRGDYGRVSLELSKQDAKRLQWLLEYALKCLLADHKVHAEKIAAGGKICEAVQSGWRNVARSDGDGEGAAPQP